MANMEALKHLCGKRSFAERKEMETSGLIKALVEILKKRHAYDNKGEEVTNESFTMAWDMLSMFVKIDNLDDAREYGQGSPSQVCVALGALDYCVEEMVANYDNCKPVVSVIYFSLFTLTIYSCALSVGLRKTPRISRVW